MSSNSIFLESKMICNKEKIVLLRNESRENDKNTSSYRIIFNVHNSKFPIHSIIGLKLYTLLYELNRDIIHTFKVINETETTIETVSLFKPFGKDFGMAPKAMHTVSRMHLESGLCTFNSVDVEQDQESNQISHIPKKYERIHSKFSNLIIYFQSENDLQFNFTFELTNESDEEEMSSCPVYMENSIALMIKKMFYRLKIFIESMK